MIEISLLPDNLKISREGKWKLLLSPLVLGVLFFLSLFIVGQVFFTGVTVSQGIEIAAIQKQVAVLTESNKEIVSRKLQIIERKDRLKKIDALMKRPFFWSSFLNALTESMTKGIWLRGFSIANNQSSSASGDERLGNLRLEGSAIAKGEETAYIGKFIKQLKDNAYLGVLFEQIELSNINQKKIKEFDVYDFVLIGLFRKEKV